MSREIQALKLSEFVQSPPSNTPGAAGTVEPATASTSPAASSRWWLLWLVALACVIVNLNSLGNGWTLDDASQVISNQNIQNGFSLKTAILDQLPPGFDKLDKNYRPITDLSYRLNYLLGNEGTTVYRVTNILLAALCSVWLFLALRQLFRDPLAAFWAALFFAVLPVHAEAVNSIAWGRGELLGCWFGLIVLHLHVVRIRRHSRQRLLVALTGAFAFLALLANERMWTLPAIVLLTEFLVVAKAYWRRSFALFWKRSLPAHALMWAGLLASVALRSKVLGEWMPGPLNPLTNPLQFESFAARFWTGLKLVWHGLLLQLLPVNLSHDYSWYSIPIQSGWGWPALVLLVLGGAWIAAIVFSARLAPSLAAGMTIYSVAALGFANIFYLTPRMFAEHYLYWPSVGVAILLGCGVTSAMRMVSRKYPMLPLSKLVAATAVLLVVSQAAVSAMRNRDWKDMTTLIRADLPKYPANVIMRMRAGNFLLREGRVKEAEAQFLTGYWVHPGAHELIASLSAGYLSEREYGRALKAAEAALRLAPNNPGYRVNLGVVLARSGKADAAAQVWQQVIDQFPGYPYSYFFRALVRESRKDFWGAEQDYLRAIELAPGFKPAQNRLEQLRYLLEPQESKQLLSGNDRLP